ncbi:MAG: Por secretion system C-terminal sorting protein/choice-of-anchor [Hymenobacter sp.]|nr:Por secretion system C-terminal sorting protein/choice-of-anchor [Hymenobacter sp.]
MEHIDKWFATPVGLAPAKEETEGPQSVASRRFNPLLFIGLVVLLLFSNWASQAQTFKPRVLLLAADEQSWTAEVQAKLMNTGAFTSVSTLDWRSAAPSLSYLQGFDAVLLWDDYSPYDGIGSGNALAQYIDGGGGVVSAVFANASVPVQGQYNSSAYLVIIPLYQTQGTHQVLGTVLLPSHPIMQGVRTFDGGSSSYRSTSNSVTAGSVRVANWNDGGPLVAVKENVGPANARRADLNFFPPSSDSRSDFWMSASDGTTLMKNALLWVAKVSPAPIIATSLTGNSFCAGSAASVAFATTDTFNPGNTFTAQLSDASGSFISPTTIGTLAGTASGSIIATIPVATSAASGYRVRVVSSNPVVTGTDNGSNLTINSAPVVTVPANIMVNNGASQCGASVAFVATATGSPAPNMVYSANGTPITSPYAFALGTTTVTATATNSCGSDTGTFTVTVEDHIAPTAQANDIAVQLDASGNASIIAAQVDNGSTDNCSVASITVAPSTFTCANVGTNPVVLTVTDASGNQSTATASVTVVDNVLPTITAPIAVTVNTDTGQCTASNVAMGMVTAADNCAATVTNDAPATFSKGVTTVTWTATDGAGNVATATQTITVIDATAPTAVAKNVTVQLDANGNATLTGAQVNNGSTDACGIATLTVSPSAFSCSNIGPNTVTLTVTDAAGNASTATATATVVDGVAPTVRTQPVTVYLNTAGQASLTAAQVNNGSWDACGVASVVVSRISFSCANLGANTVNLTVTDTHGNVAVSAAVVTVADAIAPTLSNVPSDICALALLNNCSAIVTWTAPRVADNCSAVITSSHTSGAAFPVGVSRVTITATDLAGNRTNSSFNVTVLGFPMFATLDTPSTCGDDDEDGHTTTYNIPCYGRHTGKASVCVIGGCQPYSYLWSNGQTTSTIKNLAAGTYTVTITDANGAQIVRSITLTQAPALAVTASATTAFTGAASQTIYRGYGAQSLTLRGAATGGVGSYSYTWAPAVGLNRTTGSSVTATPAATTTYTVTATDANGCAVATATVTIAVIDVRCGTRNDKVTMCQNGQALCVSTSQVPGYLSRGGTMGACPTANRSTALTASTATTPSTTTNELAAYPNPASDQTTVSFRTALNGQAKVVIYNELGQAVASLFDGAVNGGQRYSLTLNSQNLASGLYVCRFVLNGKTEMLRLTITH